MNTIDHSPERVDALVKVTGRAQYAADAKPPNCLIALALGATMAPARIMTMNTANARALTGVVDVFTHEDTYRLSWNSTPAIDALSAENLGREALGDNASKGPAFRPLISDEVGFAGQWIALVVAETIEIAREALALIQVELASWIPPASAPIRPGPFFAGHMQHAFDTLGTIGAITVSQREIYETPMQLHQPMEPTATTAIWNGDSVTLHDSTQGVLAARDYIAVSLDIAPEKVRVLSPFVGGGFGAKNQIWPHQALAAHMARFLGRPVCMQLTRADMAVVSGHRSETHQILELEADAEGRLGLLRHESHVPTSLKGGFFEPCGLNSLLLYKAIRIVVSHHVTRQPIPTPTPFRAPGETPGSFALETALDELACKLGQDPVALRMRNFAVRDHYHQREWSSNDLAECYRVGAERIGWHLRSPDPRCRKRDGRLVGMGMATTAYPAPALPASVRLRLSATGALLVETSATDIGTGMRTLLAQHVIETLGVSSSNVEVVLGDSALPNAPTAGRSKSTASVLPAAAQACRAMLAALDQIDMRPAGNMALHERLMRTGRSELSVDGHSVGLAVDKDLSFYSFGAHFVEVELDERIGRLRVSKVVSVIDGGRILNAKLAASQIRGGVTFGIGMAIMELGGRHSGSNRILTDNLADYAVPVHADVPQIDVVFTNKPDTLMNELGARGVGEIGLPGVAAAIGNAVFNACGRRARKLPISSEILCGI
jgi:xanthine dehydrogenase YagR molybdenum-binding subunit